MQEGFADGIEKGTAQAMPFKSYLYFTVPKMRSPQSPRPGQM